MNMPVPPVFLHEKTFNSYEVLDGQQRITAITDFYEGRLRLKSLERWAELNEMTYAQRRHDSDWFSRNAPGETDQAPLRVRQLWM